MSILRANIRTSGSRLIAAGITVAISTAFIVAGLLLVGSFNASVAEEAEAEAAGADLIIRTDSLIDGQDPDAWDDYEQDSELERHADEDLMEQVEALDSVASAEPVRSAFLETSAAREADGVPFGVSASQLTDSMEFEMLDGEAPSADDEAMVSEVAAEAFGIAVGDTLTASLQVADEEADGDEEAEGRILETDYEVVGIADLPGSPRSLLTEGGMERLPYNPTPSEIRVVLPDGQNAASDQEAVREQVQELTSLPVMTQQEVVDEWVEQQTGSADVLIWITLGFGAVAVFVSILVITNTFSVLVAMRQRTMALLRAVGADAAQLRRATIAEGAVLGAASAVGGVLLGWGGATVFVVVANAVADAGLPLVGLDVRAAAVGLVVGVGMTTFASVWPAVRAGRVSPMAALAPVGLAASAPRFPTVRLLAGILMAAVGLAMVLWAGLSTGEEIDGTLEPATVAVLGLPMVVVGVLGAMTMFLGALLLARLVIPPLVGWLGAVLSHVPGLGMVARLAGENARQVPGRTAATASALLIGVTLVSTFTIGAATAERLLYDELDESFPVDGIAVGLSEADQELLAEDSRVESTAELGIAEGTLTGADQQESEPVTVLVADPQSHADMVRHSDFYPEPGEISMSADTVGQMGVGSSLTLEAEGQSITVTGREDFGLPQGTTLISAQEGSETWAALDPATDGTALIVRLQDGLSMGQIANLAGQLESEEVIFDGALSHASMVGFVDILLGIVLGLLGAAIVVAVIGVSNTLSLSVLERRREGALLRAVGMSRRAVARTISVEAILMAAAALIVGSALGALFGWAGVASVAPRPDWVVTLEIPWLRMGAVWLAALAAALLAAWLPARRMSKVRPAQGLAA